MSNKIRKSICSYAILISLICAFLVSFPEMLMLLLLDTGKEIKRKVISELSVNCLPGTDQKQSRKKRELQNDEEKEKK